MARCRGWTERDFRAIFRALGDCYGSTAVGEGIVGGKIFLNYRRGDDPGFTQALYQRLEDTFTAAALFMDVAGHIKPGDDFVEVLNSQVAACDVLLAVIGPRWADLLAARQEDPDDFVVIEIKAALSDRDKRVIPVLVGGASIPRSDILPEPIRQLARRNGTSLRPERFKGDCQDLISVLKEQLAEVKTRRTTSEVQAEQEWLAVRDSRDLDRLVYFEQYYFGTDKAADARKLIDAIEAWRRQDDQPTAIEKNWRTQKGIICSKTDKGFGFIKREGVQETLFFRSFDLVGTMFGDLSLGDTMMFEIAEGPKGKIAQHLYRVRKNLT